MEESLQEIERQVEIAITSVKKMEKYDGIWHPDAKKGVSLPFTDAVVIALHAILGTARQIRSNIEETRKENFKIKRSDFGFPWPVKPQKQKRK